MKKMMMAVAMTIALPAAAFAQATPATFTPPAAPAHAGHDMKAMDCKDMHSNMSGSHSDHQMSGASGQLDHSKMDHSKMAGCGETAKAGVSQAPADPRANHKQ